MQPIYTTAAFVILQYPFTYYKNKTAKWVHDSDMAVSSFVLDNHRTLHSAVGQVDVDTVYRTLHWCLVHQHYVYVG